MGRVALSFFLFFLVMATAFQAAAQQAEQQRYNQLNRELGELYNQGRYEEAIPLAKEALSIVEKALGRRDPNTAKSMHILATLYRAAGEYGKAEPLYRESLSIREEKLGPEHQETAASLNDLALLYKTLGDYVRSEPLYQKALALYEKGFGKGHINTAAVLNNLAELYEALGDYKKAEPLFTRALSIAEQVLGPDHRNTATARHNLAGLYQNMGEYDRAEPLYQRVLAVREKTLGPDHPDTAMALGSLAGLYKQMGEFSKAESFLQRALRISEKGLGPDHIFTAATLGNLAGLYEFTGDYEKAESFYQQCLAIFDRTIGPSHPDAAVVLGNLAGLHRRLGDYDQAASLYNRSLGILEKSVGPKHPTTASTQSSLAELYGAMGEHARAVKLAIRSLEAREETLGPNHPDTAGSLHSLAVLYANQGRQDQAEPLLNRALAIREETLGPAHHATAATMSHLANLYKNRGEFAKAEPLFVKVLNVVVQSLGRQNPDVLASLNNLGLIAGAKGDYETAQDYHKQAQDISARLIDQVMGFTSEDQKLRFLASQRESLELSLGLAAFHVPGDREAAGDALTVWLRRKGVILEAQQRYQEALVLSGDRQAMEVFRELADVRSQLSRLVFSGPGLKNPKAHRARIAGLEARQKELEARLSKLSASFAREKKVRQADPAQVASALPRGGVLVDFALVRPYDYKAFGAEERWGPAHYLAFVLPAGRPGDLALVDLGEAGPIDREIAKLKTAVSGLNDAAGKTAEEAGAELYRLVFAKLETKIKTARQIFISPDGNLNLIPFEVFRKPDGEFLIQNYSFNYLSSGRDLTGFGLVGGAAGPSLLMGDPDFDLDSKSKKRAMRTLDLEGRSFVAQRSPETRGMRFSALPGTGEELAAVRAALGPSAKVYTGAMALEEVLVSQDKPPRILHLATHGFFLTDQQIERLGARGLTTTDDAPVPGGIRIENPLLRSGLALAGANRGADSSGSEGSDGLLTAEEVLGLNLRGTDMVVLSACNTGVGEVQAGEGVYGLRRAFVQAGAEGLVMSMWPVPDRETKELMETFYKHISSGETSRLEALRQAALEQLEVAGERYGHPHPLFWGAFVYMGNPGH